MGKTKGIRHRLLTILLLGVIVSALTLTALIHLLSTTTRQRVERARDTVTEQVERLAQDPSHLSEPSAASFVGLRGGLWDGAIVPRAMPANWAPTVQGAVLASKSSGALTLREQPLGDTELVVAARPAGVHGLAWAGFQVRPLPSLRTWQWIVSLLALGTAVLVATTIYSIVTVQKGASELRVAIQALATDARVSIPKPSVRELALVAEGVASLADGLARSRREEQRLQGELASRERLAALGRVVAGVAHEVRNPLASIKLRLDLAAGAAELPKEVEAAIAHATTEIARLDRLVADLLIVSGRASGNKLETSVGSLVRARVDAALPWAGERAVSISVKGEARLEIDTDAIARTIDNLLRNAVEASARDQQVDIELVQDDEKVVISFSDEGAGIAPGQAAQLFEPFFTTKPDGTGLGLALCRSIARAHAGDVVYVQDGARTRFDLILRAPKPGQHVPAAQACSTSGEEARLA